MSKRACLALLNRLCREALAEVEHERITMSTALEAAIAAAEEQYGVEITAAVITKAREDTSFCSCEAARTAEAYSRLCVPAWVNGAMRTL